MTRTGLVETAMPKHARNTNSPPEVPTASEYGAVLMQALRLDLASRIEPAVDLTYPESVLLLPVLLLARLHWSCREIPHQGRVRARCYVII